MIDVVLFDVDGVLTDGAVYVNAEGKESKKILFDDIDGFFELKRNGFKLGFITAENTPFCDYVSSRFEPLYFARGSKNKLDAFNLIIKEHGLNSKTIAYVGDSPKDIPLLEMLDVSFAPSDAPEVVKSAAKIVLKSARGKGVIKEVAEKILSLKKGDANVSYWQTRIDQHLSVIQTLRNSESILQTLNKIADVIIEAFKKKNQFLLCGNGGSASDCQHIAGELVSRFFLERPGLNAEALSANIATLTAIGNDYSYERIFARQVEAKGSAGDVLMGLSTSGNSKNVVEAMKVAKNKGMVTIGFTGNREKTLIAEVSDYLIQVPSPSTPRIQEGHMLLAHTLCELIEEKLFKP